MAISFEAFLWSITQQESGGNYRALGPWINGDRAYGRYQVMGSNVGNWTAKYYGRRLSPQEFLNNPAAQDAVVAGVLGGYFKRYGPAGAAAMWYSGQPDPSKTYGNPPVYRYVNSVISRAGGYSGQKVLPSGGASDGGGSFNLGSPVVPQLTDSERAEQYGLSMRLINSSSELKKLFKQAVAGSWSAARFSASLQNTKWWRGQSSTLRKYITTKIVDPATWKQQDGAALVHLNDLGIQVGLTNQLVNGKPTELLKKVTYWSRALGWSDARIKNYLGGFVGTHDGIMFGAAGEAWDKLHALAYTNGVSYSWQWFRDRSRDIVAGRTTQETVEAKIRAAAGARYSAFRDQILAGQNVIDLAAPYIKSVSDLLELPATDVDVFNRHVQHAMTTKTTPSKEGGSQMPLWQFENEVRADPLWLKTNNARESMMGVAHQVAKDFGLAF